MTAEEILALAHPEKIFSGDEDADKTTYRELARQWHPDARGGRTDVFQKVAELYQLREDKIKDGTWEGAGTLELVSRSGGARHMLRYRVSRRFELGRTYIGGKNVVHVVERAHKDLWMNGVAHCSVFSYASDKMREEVSRYLPHEVESYELRDGRFVLRTAKDPRMVLLRDVLGYVAEFNPKHAAWVGSSLFNLACYLRWAGLSHQGISPDTYFINPEQHNGALLGGWWYATKLGKPVKIIPRFTDGFLPWEVRTSKRASHLTDLELVRATVRELVGGAAATALAKPVPEAMSRMLLSAASEEPKDEFRRWYEALEKSFGKRRFTKWELTAEDVYGRK